METTHEHKTIGEWQAILGVNIRSIRMQKNLDQKQLAAQSGASLTAIRRLETGLTTTTETLISVLRTLGKTDWLSALAPTVDINPIQMARQASKTPRKRVHRVRS